MTDSPDTTQGPFEWTVTALSIYGKQMLLVPPCSHLPTLKHVSKLSQKDDIMYQNRSEGRYRAMSQHGINKPNEATIKANNHIWKPWNKEHQI